MNDPTKPQRPVLTLKGKGAKPTQKAAAGHGGKGHGKGGKPQKPPPQPPEPGQQCRLCGAYRRTKVPGPAASAPRPPQEFMAICWMVMRSTGRRPQVRHQTLDEAQVEAARIAASSPGIEVWILEARTIDTVQAQVAAPVSEILR